MLYWNLDFGSFSLRALGEKSEEKLIYERETEAPGGLRARVAGAIWSIAQSGQSP